MGAANIAVYTSFATMPNYERGYGLFVLMQFVVSGLGLYFLIIYSQNIGVQGMYLSLATLDLIALFLVRYLPNRSTTMEVDDSSHTEIKVLLSLATLFAVVGFGLFEASGFAQFTYIERVGMAIPLSELTVGNIMLVSSANRYSRFFSDHSNWNSFWVDTPPFVWNAGFFGWYGHFIDNKNLHILLYQCVSFRLRLGVVFALYSNTSRKIR